jgi:hypothetical protein
MASTFSWCAVSVTLRDEAETGQYLFFISLSALCSLLEKKFRDRVMLLLVYVAVGVYASPSLSPPLAVFHPRCLPPSLSSTLAVFHPRCLPPCLVPCLPQPLPSMRAARRGSVPATTLRPMTGSAEHHQSSLSKQQVSQTSRANPVHRYLLNPSSSSGRSRGPCRLYYEFSDGMPCT